MFTSTAQGPLGDEFVTIFCKDDFQHTQAGVDYSYVVAPCTACLLAALLLAAPAVASGHCKKQGCPSPRESRGDGMMNWGRGIFWGMP